MKNKGVSKYFANPFILFGTPGWIRTSDLQLRRLTPYPLGYGRSVVNSQAASFDHEPRFHFFEILEIAASIPPVSKTFKPCSESKPTTCERTTYRYKQMLHLLARHSLSATTGWSWPAFSISFNPRRRPTTPPVD